MLQSPLTGKTILVVSPQYWGTMLVSKHHYALELAKRGNQVYYVNPPDNHHWNWKTAAKRITVSQSALHSNLYLVDQVLYFPYIFKYHFRSLYNVFIKRQIKQVLDIIGKPMDIIWSFDIGNLFPLQFFNINAYKIFHPVDEPGDEQAIEAARSANIIFSVTREILDKYKNYPVPRNFINHGLADEFLKDLPLAKSDKIRAGMSGNLLRTDLDRETLLKILGENPQVEFHFFGSYQTGQSNLSGGTDAETRIFINKLKSFTNVRLMGMIRTNELAQRLNEMDILLICYDMEKDQSKGTNYHKVMEYLSTGKVIVSNNITTYSNEPDFVRMVESRIDNKELPALFRETVLHIQEHNRSDIMEKRKSFARNNTYRNQLDLIAGKIKANVSQLQDRN